MEHIVNTKENGENISICPVTKLPEYTRSEWKNICVGDNFRMSFSVLGKNIFVVKSYGKVDAETMELIRPIANSVIDEVFKTVKKVVYLVDMQGLISVSTDGRKSYIQFLKEHEKLTAIVLCASAPLMVLSIRLARRFNKIDFHVVLEKDFNIGLKKALRFSTTVFEKKEKPVFYIPEKITGYASYQEEKCPVSGLPVVTKPEWTNIDLGGPSVTFWVIGGKILSSSLNDWSDINIDTFRRLFEERRKVINEMFGDEGKFIEIRDYLNFEKGAAGKLRSEFVALIKPDLNRILAFIGYNTPLIVRLSFSVGQKLYAPPFLWKNCKNYTAAINYAIGVLGKHGDEITKKPIVYTKDDWQLDLDGFSTRYEVINGDIIHRITKGFLLPEHVEPSYQLQCRVFEEAGLTESTHYFITDVRELRGSSFKARKLYLEYIVGWIKDYKKCRVMSNYGANKMVRTSLLISNYLTPFQINLCDTLEEALMLVADDKVNMMQGTMKPLRVKKSDHSHVQKYSSELLNFLGNINWELDGHSQPVEIVAKDHPFKTVYDAITLIKSDVDELFGDNERTKTALEESKRIANVLTQEIIKTQENERQRIARDLHDNVAQDLASLIITNDSLFDGYEDIPHDIRRKAMKNSRTLKRAIESIRELAYDLRPPSLDQLGLVKTISRYCVDFSETNMMNIDFYTAGLNELKLDFDTEINIYRIIQEALNNIKKHANSTYVTVNLLTSFPHIILKIEDDGDGFDLESRRIEALKEKRMGLQSMEERAKLMSGDFILRTQVGKGTMIRVTLPYE